MNKLLTLGSFLLSLSIYGQSIEQPRRIPIDGFYTNPLFSPTGEFVLLSTEHLKGVYLLDLSNNSVRQISDKDGSGYAYSWDRSGDFFYFKEKPEKGYFSDSKVASYNVRDHYVKKMAAINHNYLPSYQGNSKENTQQTIVYTDPADLKIKAMDLVSSRHWTVTNDEGQFYNAILSNDGKKVAVHKGADIFIYNTDGSSNGRRIGTGIATAWTTDDSYLIGFLDESSDGHVVSNSELYLFDIEDAKAKKITDTVNSAEMFPTVYKDRIIFADDKTGGIYTATLKMK